MNWTPPTSEQQVEFLRNVQRLLAEGQFVASYKFALLHALADLAVLKGDDSGAPLKIGTKDIASKFVELYWRQARPFEVGGGATGLVLQQNTGRQAAIISQIAGAQRDCGGSLPRFKNEAIGRMVEQMRVDDLRPKTIEQYLIVVNHLRRAFPTTTGPAEITPAMASRFKAIRRPEGVAVRTIRGNLGIVYNKWWIKECRLLASDPFAGVDPPKADKPSPRIVTPDEAAAFLGWLSGRWGGWRLPLLFLHVKGLIGCRITELASARSRGLRDGRIEFEAVATKGRKRRVVKLPAPSSRS